MVTARLLAGALVIGSVSMSTSARADGELAAAPPVVTTNATPSHVKPGVIATGVVLSAFGAGHVILGALLAAHVDCRSGEWDCFSEVFPGAAISLVAGATLLAVGIPLIVYGSTAKPNKPHLQVGVSPNGLSFSGAF